MRRLGPCAAAVAIAIAACGGSSSSGDDVDAAITADSAPPDATPVVTIDDICGTDGVYNKLIAKILSCDPGLDFIAFQGQATPGAITALCHGAIDPYVPGSIGLPTYAELQTCLTYVASTSCLDLDFNAPACNALHGKIADAMGCDTTDQCLDASYCDRPNTATCGTCKPRLADGLACTTDEMCANGKCVGTQCGHPGQDGDPCVIDATTKSSDDCLGQRLCDPQTHQCVTKNWQLNDTCTDFGQCGLLYGSGMYCKIPQGQQQGQCAAFLKIGDPCGGTLGTCDLIHYEWCNQVASTPRCTAPTTVQKDAACGALTGKQCAAGLACSDPINGGKCYTPGVKDDACGASGDAPCGALLKCDEGTCEYTDDTPACP